MQKYIAMFALLALCACQPATESAPEPAADMPAEPGASAAAEDRLAALLAAQPEEVQARYQYRHPQETLEFFGVAPGMTVVEGLPGRGWYSKILLPYLGADGKLIGASYAMDMWPNFAFANEEFLKTQETWVTDWPAGAEAWRGEDGASIAAFNFGAMPESMAGTADVVLLIRA
ncbi:MAG: methyltransferase, partial [Gammaproteobacteria bacterium]|nr:methyltransferase [Gammaproteobacteria bacterium]